MHPARRHGQNHSVTTGFFRVPLPEILTDSMHGIMRDFELVTATVRDADGAEGVGYTFTVGRNGGAIANIISTRDVGASSSGLDADLIEAIWMKLWWDMHYGGRGGPTVLALSAVDMALWDLKARKLSQPLWKLLGGFSDRVPCYAGGIDLELPLPRLADADRPQPRARLPCHQDEGWPQAPVRGCGARRRDAQASGRRIFR